MRRRIRGIGINLKKYSIRRLKYLATTEEYKQYSKAIRGVIPRRKIERQWWDLRAKFGYQISKKRSDAYYRNLRKANRKLARIGKDSDLLKDIRLGYGVSWMKTARDFVKAEKRLAKILNRNYKKHINREVRDKLYHNLVECFGYNEYTNRLIQEFDRMSDSEYRAFFDKYQDIDIFNWGSPKEIQEYINLTKMNYETIQSYIEAFAKANNLDIVVEMI